ncbi:MAG: nucleotidyltransferase family protein [Thermodesulfobacteriota bacterium]
MRDKTALSREEEIVLACCRQEVPAAGRLRPADWGRVAALAEREGVVTLLYTWMERHGLLSDLPDRVRTDLFNRYYLTAGAVVVWQTELQKILRLAARMELAFLALKGVVLAETVYDNPVLRPMSDIDLLVRPEDFSRARNVLGLAGYRPLAGEGRLAPGADYLTSLRFVRNSGPFLPIHLHTHLVNSTVPNRKLAAAVPMADIWRRARPVSLCGQPALALAAHHQLLHLAEHGLRVSHSLTRWRYLCDIDRTVRHHRDMLDWDLFCATVLAAGLQRFVYHPLALAGRRLETPVPTEVLVRLRPRSGWEDRTFTLLLERNIRKPGLSYLLHLAQQENPVAKLHFLYRTVLPPREVLAVRYGLSTGLVHHGHYLRRMLEIGTTLLGAASAGLLGSGGRVRSDNGD